VDEVWNHLEHVVARRRGRSGSYHPLGTAMVENPRLGWTRRQTIEVALLFLGLCSTAWVVFGGRFHSALKNYPFEYLCIPFLIWATFRFGRRKATTAVCALAVIATWGTLRGFGPFARESHNTSLLLLQTFMGIMAIMSVALAAEVTEHKRAEEHVRRLATSDPLTGLANYGGFLTRWTWKSRGTGAREDHLRCCCWTWTG